MNGVSDRKAIPTEYRGVRFRSKSEAVFARVLDLCGHEWEYEPEQPKCLYSGGARSNHRWDFYLPLIDYYLEYKPKKPTATYIQNLRHDLAFDYDELYYGRKDPAKFFIVYGSPWLHSRQKSPYDMISVDDNSTDACNDPFGKMGIWRNYFIRRNQSGVLVDICAYIVKDATIDLVTEAAAYRFDLE